MERIHGDTLTKLQDELDKLSHCLYSSIGQIYKESEKFVKLYESSTSRDTFIEDLKNNICQSKSKIIQFCDLLEDDHSPQYTRNIIEQSKELLQENRNLAKIILEKRTEFRILLEGTEAVSTRLLLKYFEESK